MKRRESEAVELQEYPAPGGCWYCHGSGWEQFGRYPPAYVPCPSPVCPAAAAAKRRAEASP